MFSSHPLTMLARLKGGSLVMASMPVAASRRSFFAAVRGLLRPEFEREAERITMFSADTDTTTGQVGTWRHLNDSDYGGESMGEWRVLSEAASIPLLAHLEACAADNASTDDTPSLSSRPVAQRANEGGEGVVSDNSVSFARMSGAVRMSDEVKEQKKVLGGFCAFKGSLRGGAVDLRDHEGLELVIRTRKPEQSFMLNMSTQTFVDEDIYQVKIELKGSPSNDWKVIHIPFHLFHLTARGVSREQQRANDSLRVESFGFLFKEEDNSAFDCVEIPATASVPTGELFEDADEGSIDTNTGGFDLDLHSITAVVACDDKYDRELKSHRKLSLA